MSTTIKNIITGLLALVVCMTLGIASASANPGDATIAAQPTVVSSSSESTVLGATEEGVSTTSQVYLEQMSATPKKVKGCPKVSSFKRRGNARCITLPVGTPFQNEGRTRENTSKYFNDNVKKGDQKFYFDSKTKQWRKASCKNGAKFSGKAPLDRKDVVLVKSFQDATFDVELELKGAVEVAATATCVTATASATAIARGKGAFAARVKVKVKARSSVKARSAASVSVTQKQEVEIQAQILAVMDLSASASVSCSGKTYICPTGNTWNGTACVKDGTTTPTPTTTTPGTTPAPADTVSAKCYWESAGTYKNVPHASGEAVRQDQLGANGACPVGSFGV